ncbi:MAG: hypothetical protein ACRDYE_08645 [Acidimicrobiales bacterium]
MNGEGSPGWEPGRRGPPRRLFSLVSLVGVALVAVAVGALTVQAVRADRTVRTQLGRAAVRDATLDDAFYRCIDVQARSLVSPGQPVLLAGASLGDDITLVKGVGSWVTIADPPSTAVARLTLRNHVGGTGTCLGTVVVARYAAPRQGVVVEVGTGASVAGQGPPPTTPL